MLRAGTAALTHPVHPKGSPSVAPRPQPPGPAVFLTCADEARRIWSAALSTVPDDPGSRVVDLPGRPGRAEVDPLLDDDLAPDRGARVVVVGTDADLAAVLVRLLRRERLDLTVALLPVGPGAAAGVWGLPDDDRAALELARHGTPATVPLLRDDRGGVVAAEHRVAAFSGVVYCDEREVLRGDADGLVVRPDPGAGVAVTVTGRRRLAGLRPGREYDDRGRAATIGCRPAELARDGIADDRPLERRSWYRHVEDWRLACRPDLRHRP